MGQGIHTAVSRNLRRHGQGHFRVRYGDSGAEPCGENQKFGLFGFVNEYDPVGHLTSGPCGGGYGNDLSLQRLRYLAKSENMMSSSFSMSWVGW